MWTLRDHGCQLRLLYPAKHSITIDEQSKIFHDKTRFNHYLITNPVLYKILEGKLQPKKATSTILQTIDDLTVANPKERKNTHNSIIDNENKNNKN